MQSNPYRILAECLLPVELVEHFDLIDVKVGVETIDVYLDEKKIIPEGYTASALQPNGFTESSIMRDFPLRGKKMTFHIRRRRWLKLPEKTNVVKDWHLVAEGTRHSKEFAAFKRIAWRNTRLRATLLNCSMV